VSDGPKIAPEDRIRAHVLLCWLSLLLIRIAETGTGHTWNKMITDPPRIIEATPAPR
jgi:transposase